jgi:undecaprenyldiphospho-muramoylpentapeptide beta-N-acetylglucosaminyltransferase
VRLLICAGGTGGGVYPALAVLQTMQNKAEVLWVGGIGGMEAQLVERTGIPFTSIPAAGIHGVGLKKLPGNAIKLAGGFRAAQHILQQFKPDALFFTGGYVAVPMALAGLRVPTLLYVPDIEPALALKTLANFADVITVTSKDSLRFFNRRKRVIVTGYPTRPDLSTWTLVEARRVLKIKSDAPVLLVMGGSKGARSINNALMTNLMPILEIAQVIHITGELDWPKVEEKLKSLSNEQANHYHAFPYLHNEMGAALRVADLVISRAGASTLGEYPLFGLPAVLVPYPHAWHYQKVNAESLVSQGAALMVIDSELEERFLPTIQELLQNPIRLKTMQEAIIKLSRPQAAAEIGHLLLKLARKKI